MEPPALPHPTGWLRASCLHQLPPCPGLQSNIQWDPLALLLFPSLGWADREARGAWEMLQERHPPRRCCKARLGPSPAFLSTVPLVTSKLLVKPALEWRVSFKKLPFSTLWDVTSLRGGPEHLGTLASLKALPHPCNMDTNSACLMELLRVLNSLLLC